MPCIVYETPQNINFGGIWRISCFDAASIDGKFMMNKNVIAEIQLRSSSLYCDDRMQTVKHYIYDICHRGRRKNVYLTVS